jgi:predicted N-acetyltransferase YhbS
MSDAISTEATGRVTLREVEPGDAEACAQILFDAFGSLHDHHRFPRDFPVLEAAVGMMGMSIPHPSIWGVVAEIDGRIVGSNFLDERDPIRGVGPITVDPESQEVGVGRKLMEAVMERGSGAPGIRHAGRVQYALALALRIARVRRDGARCGDQREAAKWPRSGG